MSDLCPGCSLPTHASESDDDGYHAGCRPEEHASLGDYYRTGIQDCQNVISLDEFDVRGGMRKGWTAEQIVDHTLDGPDWQDREDWLEQCEASDRRAHGDAALWDNWKAGWRARAIEIIRGEMSERCALHGGLECDC